MIEFYLGSKLICSLSIEGTFIGEVKSTKELLAYENKCTVNDIEIRMNWEVYYE